MAEFHEFVRPTEHPELTDFCKKLTHLEKKDLSVEKSLEEVMVDFALWAKDVQREHDLYFYTPKGNEECIETAKSIFRCKRKQRLYEKNLLYLHLDRLGHFNSTFKRNEAQKDRNS